MQKRESVNKRYERKKETMKSCEVDGVVVEDMDEVNCKDTSSVNINQKRVKGIIGIEQSAMHNGWYRAIEGMYKTSPECNQGQINDE